jgi:hypothetical protein
LPKSGIDIVDITMWTTITFCLTVLIVYPLKKIPIVTKLIG